MSRREIAGPVVINCARCGSTGKATFEENSTPPHHGGHFDERPTWVGEGFRLDKGKIICNKCGSTLRFE